MSDERHPKVGVGVIVLNDEGNVLVRLRRGAHGAGTYGLLGGHLEFGESWEDCARREAKEEADLELTDVQFVGVTNDIMSSEDKHYVTIFMQAKAVAEAKNVELEFGEEWAWHPWDEIPTPRFLPFDNFYRDSGYHPINGWQGTENTSIV